VTGGQGIIRSPHVKKIGFDRVRVSITHGRNDLLVNIRSQGPPVPFGRIPGKQGGILIVHVVADIADPEARHLMGVKLSEGEGWPSLPPVVLNVDTEIKPPR